MFQLSMAMGRWIDEIEQLPVSMLLEYMAFYNIEPWGEKRADLRHGYAAAVTYNLQRGRGARPLKAKDFMPDFSGPVRQSPEHIRNVLVMYAKSHNANLEKKNGKHR